MLLPLLMNNLMSKKPTPPTPTPGSGSMGSGAGGGAGHYHSDDKMRRERIEREDNEIFEVIKTFIQCL